MREIKFRGKSSKDDLYFKKDGWIHGSLQIFKGFSIFDSSLKNWFTVYGKTVGQYTGLKDKNGKEIYEGDIVKRHFFIDYDYFCNVPELIGEVIFEDGAFIVKNGNYITPLFMEIQECNGESFKHYEVIGNIYENKELIGEDK